MSCLRVFYGVFRKLRTFRFRLWTHRCCASAFEMGASSCGTSRKRRRSDRSSDTEAAARCLRGANSKWCCGRGLEIKPFSPET